jgi:hypothetical protein
MFLYVEHFQQTTTDALAFARAALLVHLKNIGAPLKTRHPYRHTPAPSLNNGLSGAVARPHIKVPVPLSVHSW